MLVTVGGGDLRLFGLAAGLEIVVGRDLDCDLVLDHHRVSRRHARLRVGSAGESLTVEDLGSRTGTRVGEPIASNRARTVEPGDAIAIGPFTLLAMRGPPGLPAASLVIDDPLGMTPTQVLVSVARSPANIFVRCEHDHGTFLLAETLHRLAGRTGPLVSLDCGSISAAQFQRELAAATSGTVFLDDIEALPPLLQDILVLHPADRPKPRAANKEAVARLPRFISAAYRDLPGAVASGAFREDLYYALGCVTFVIPPLRERRSKIAGMVRELIGRVAAREHCPAPELSAAAEERLTAHAWPGNLGELRDVVERALQLAAAAPGAVIEPVHLELAERAPEVSAGGAAGARGAAATQAIEPPAGSFDLASLALDGDAERCQLIEEIEPATVRSSRSRE